MWVREMPDRVRSPVRSGWLSVTAALHERVDVGLAVAEGSADAHCCGALPLVAPVVEGGFGDLEERCDFINGEELFCYRLFDCVLLICGSCVGWIVGHGNLSCLLSGSSVANYSS